MAVSFLALVSRGTSLLFWLLMIALPAADWTCGRARFYAYRLEPWRLWAA
jgi:hypothetical protein